ncbi:MAG TPA: 3-phosphoshikimate 1-carboxyvinyltransferase [Terriglobia bacterium]|nr:3-phosphoshikimate 1-carboxyvinyltransferase [Terriglobia bacterium]
MLSSTTNHQINPAKRLAGSIRFPGDKSISHRYAMLAAIAEGRSEIQGFAESADCQSTLQCLESLGVAIERQGNLIGIEGVGLQGLRPSNQPLDAGNSGSTLRMLSGILAGQPFRSMIGGDASLSRRPMKRVIEPLALMGARIESSEGGLPPLAIEGGELKPIHYELPVASAQVKTAVLFAGLFAEGKTEVVERGRTRDHSEIALEEMGARIRRRGNTLSIQGKARLEGQKLFVPGDLSSAAFFMVAGLLVPGSVLTLHDTGLNPTRTAIVGFLQSIGGKVEMLNVDGRNGELIGDVQVSAGPLQGGTIPLEIIPGLIDELPVLAVLGTQTEDGLVFHGAQELRVKESDRIAAVAENLRKMGAEVEEFPDGLRIPGRQKLHGAEVSSYGDHRIAMAFAVAGLIAEGPTTINDSSCVQISFPKFFETLESVT